MGTLLDSLDALPSSGFADTIAGAAHRLLCYWKLDDASGNPAATVGTALTAAGTPTYESAMSNGINGILTTTAGTDELYTTDTDLFPLGNQWTIGFWFDSNGQSVANTATMVGWFTDSTNRLWVNSPTAAKVQISNNTGAVALSAAVSLHDSTARYITVQQTAYGVYRCLINGVYQVPIAAEKTGLIASPGSLAQFNISSHSPITVDGQNGCYAEVAVWDGLLTDAQCLLLYNAGSGADAQTGVSL